MHYRTKYTNSGTNVTYYYYYRFVALYAISDVNTFMRDSYGFKRIIEAEFRFAFELQEVQVNFIDGHVGDQGREYFQIT
jgi:hypothetical protein